MGDGAFGYATREDGTVVISCHGRPVTSLRGKNAAQFPRRVEGLVGREAQPLMYASPATLGAATSGASDRRVVRVFRHIDARATCL